MATIEKRKLDDGTTSYRVTAQGRAIVQAVADGTLAPGQGAQLLTGLGALARIVEIDELEKRITQLEAQKNGNT